MATWADQGGREEIEPIPPCPYLVRRGQEPDYARRSNILPWQEALANQPEKWRQLTDNEGNHITTLPEIGSPAGINVTQAVSPHVVERELQEKQRKIAQEDMREVQIFSIFDALEEQDYKPNGMPRVDIVRARANMDDLTGSEIKEKWLAYQKAKGN